MKALRLDGCSSVVAHSDNWSDYQLEAGLLDLKAHRINTRIVFGLHGRRGKLGCGLREVDLEGEASCMHLAGQFPRVEYNRTEFCASRSASYAVVQQRTKHVSESLGMNNKLLSSKFVIIACLNDE